MKIPAALPLHHDLPKFLSRAAHLLKLRSGGCTDRLGRIGIEVGDAYFRLEIGYTCSGPPARRTEVSELILSILNSLILDSYFGTLFSKY